MTPFHGGVLDENRETDGVDFRYRFINQLAVLNNEDKLYFLDLPCNMLEMMIALSVRCEEQIMGDPDIGDRTSIWFWGMIKNLKLYNMTDSQYRIGYIQNVMDNLRYRKFKPNGDGGLFTISRNDIDMREIEIWDQMSWFLNEIMK